MHGDWIGHGSYFWEHSPSRALEFAESASQRRSSTISKPSVLGAVIDLGNCFDLLDYQNLVLLKKFYQTIEGKSKFGHLSNRTVDGHPTDLLLRNLDCEIIEAFHLFRDCLQETPFDSVKAVFWEGDLLYPNAGFREKNHIQLCIRNPDCIKGFFIPKSRPT